MSERIEHDDTTIEVHRQNFERHLTEILAARNRGDWAAAGDHADAIVYSAASIRDTARRKAGT